MRGYSIMSDEERQSILQQHSSFYNGYAVGNVPSNMTPLTVYDAAQDKGGVNVNNRGEVSQYANHQINESVVTEDEGKGCAKSEGGSGCIKKRGNKWIILNNKEGGVWKDGFTSEKDAQEALDAYHVNEIEADDMDVSDVQSAYDFDSKGPEQFDHSYSDDSYDLDLYAIMRMFGDSDDMGDEIDMDKEFDGHEMMRGERRAYNFDSDGGNVDVYGESKMSEKERAWEKFKELNPSINSHTEKGAYEHFLKLWNKTNSDVNEEEETEAMCEQCGLSESMCECGMYEEIDEDLHEAFKTQRDTILENFNRFKKFN